jgi:DNA-binding MarR family transcriptional regulator
MAEPRWLNEQEARVWRGYVHLKRDLSDLLERQMLRDDGLSAAEFSLLVPLSESEGGIMRARDLGLAVGWERSRLSHQVSRMEKRGLLVRENCDEDARGSMVRLTEAGREAIVAAAPAHVEAVRRYFFDALNEDDLEVLSGIFERILSGLPKTPEDPCRED